MLKILSKGTLLVTNSSPIGKCSWSNSYQTDMGAHEQHLLHEMNPPTSRGTTIVVVEEVDPSTAKEERVRKKPYNSSSVSEDNDEDEQLFLTIASWELLSHDTKPSCLSSMMTWVAFESTHKLSR